MEQPSPLVLLVEDDPRYQKLIQLNLEGAGYRVVVVAGGEQAIDRFPTLNPNLVLLDVMLPGQMDGFEVCRRLRRFSMVPIIMITAKSAETDVVAGLNLGADDYLTKPFGVPELLARVKANLRRLNLDRQRLDAATFRLGNLVIDRLQQRVTMAGQEIPLTEIEYRLLLELSKYPNQIVSFNHLLKVLWGNETVTNIQVLRQTVYRLRQKLETDPKHPQYLQNRARIGYILTAPK